MDAGAAGTGTGTGAGAGTGAVFGARAVAGAHVCVDCDTVGGLHFIFSASAWRCCCRAR